MFSFFKNQQEKVVEQQFKLWYKACMLFIEDKKILDNPRPKVGSCLFFIGSLDYLCQNNQIDDLKFAKLCKSLLPKSIYQPWLVSSLIISFYVKNIKTKFALEANLEGGKQIYAFLNKKNTMSPYVFSTLVEEWADNPDLGPEEISLFTES